MKYLVLFSNFVMWSAYFVTSFVFNLLYKNANIEAAKNQFSNPGLGSQAMLDLSNKAYMIESYLMFIAVLVSVFSIGWFIVFSTKEGKKEE